LAFAALLTKQSGPYTIFRDWTDPTEPRGEIIRTAMIQTRTTRNTDYEVFYAALEHLAGVPLLRRAPKADDYVFF
jgi:hypothetical protein